jgi:hypothetical protein
MKVPFYIHTPASPFGSGVPGPGDETANIKRAAWEASQGGEDTMKLRFKHPVRAGWLTARAGDVLEVSHSNAMILLKAHPESVEEVKDEAKAPEPDPVAERAEPPGSPPETAAAPETKTTKLKKGDKSVSKG